jgi:hypothetical protein
VLALRYFCMAVFCPLVPYSSESFPTTLRARALTMMNLSARISIALLGLFSGMLF